MVSFSARPARSVGAAATEGTAIEVTLMAVYRIE